MSLVSVDDDTRQAGRPLFHSQQWFQHLTWGHLSRLQFGLQRHRAYSGHAAAVDNNTAKQVPTVQPAVLCSSHLFQCWKPVSDHLCQTGKGAARMCLRGGTARMPWPPGPGCLYCCLLHGSYSEPKQATIGCYSGFKAELCFGDGAGQKGGRWGLWWSM